MPDVLPPSAVVVSTLSRSRRFASETNLGAAPVTVSARIPAPITEQSRGDVPPWLDDDDAEPQLSPGSDFHSLSPYGARSYGGGNYVCGVAPPSPQSRTSTRSRRSQGSRRSHSVASRPRSEPARRRSRESSATPDGIAAAILESAHRQSGSLSEGSGGDALTSSVRQDGSELSSFVGGTLDSDTPGLQVEETVEGSRQASLIGRGAGVPQRGVYGDTIEEAGITLSIGGINALDFPAGVTRGASSSASIGSRGSAEHVATMRDSVLLSVASRGGPVPRGRGRGRRGMRTVAETRMQKLDRVMQARPRSSGRSPSAAAGHSAGWSSDASSPSKHSASKSLGTGKSGGIHDTASGSSTSLQLPPRPGGRPPPRAIATSVPPRASDAARMSRAVSGGSARTAPSTPPGQCSPHASPKSSPRHHGFSGCSGADARPGRVWRTSSAMLVRSDVASAAPDDPTLSFEFPMTDFRQPDTEQLLGELARDADSGERAQDSMHSDGLPPTPTRFHSATSELTPSIHTSGGMIDSSFSESSFEADRRR